MLTLLDCCVESVRIVLWRTVAIDYCIPILNGVVTLVDCRQGDREKGRIGEDIGLYVSTIGTTCNPGHST